MVLMMLMTDDYACPPTHPLLTMRTMSGDVQLMMTLMIILMMTLMLMLNMALMRLMMLMLLLCARLHVQLSTRLQKYELARLPNLEYMKDCWPIDEQARCKRNRRVKPVLPGPCKR